MNLRKEIKRLCQECACIKPGNRCVFCPDEQPSCRYYRDGQLAELRCRYFEEYVLPADPQLEEAYWRSIDRGTDARLVYDACTRCGKTIRKRSNAQKYCEECAAAAHRAVKREHARRRRAKTAQE